MKGLREWNKPATTLVLGLGLWAFCTCVYLSNLPVNYTYDGMVFASHIEREHEALWNYFHPHHLLYTFLGRLVFLWGREHGATWDGLVALQFFDLMTGMAGILLVFHLLVRETNDRLTAGLSAAGLAFSFSYWYFSTTPGVRIFATVTPLLAWYVLTYQRKSPPLFGAVVGMAHTLAVLGHQTNLLLLPAFLGGILLLKERTLWERARAGFYYLAALTAGVIGAYAFVGRYIYYRKTYKDWVWWVFSYFHVQQWGGHLQQAGFDRGKMAMVQAFMGNTFPLKIVADFFTFSLLKTVFLYAVIVLLAALLLRIGYFWSRHRQMIWVSLLWIAAFVPFFVWWEPWNIEFWVSSTVPCWVLMGMVVSDLANQWKNPVLRLANRSVILTLWASLMTLLFFCNLHGTVARAATNAYGHKALLGALDWKVRVDDLLVLDGINTIPFYIDRYQKRRYLSLHAFLKHHQEAAGGGSAFKKGKQPEEASPENTDPWLDLSGVFQDVWKHHRKVWVLTEAVDDGENWRTRLEQLMNLPDGQLKVFFTQYKLNPVVYKGKIYFYEVCQPGPTASTNSGVEPKPVSAPEKGKKNDKGKQEKK